MKLKKIIWTLPVITIAPIVIIASCETNNSKEKEEETTKEMNQLTSNLFEKNKSNQLASISSTYELSVRTSEIEDAISKLNENKTLLSESDFNFDRSNLVSALSAIERRKQEIQAEEARVEAQRAAQERAAQEAEAQRVAQEKAQAQEEKTKTQKPNQQTTIEQSNPNTTQTSNQKKSINNSQPINIDIDKSSKQIIQQSIKNAAKAALGKTAQVAKSAADAAIATAKQNTPINPSNVSVKDTINGIISNAKEATKETAKAAAKAAGQELLRSGIKGVINLWKEKREQKKQQKVTKSQQN